MRVVVWMLCMRSIVTELERNKTWAEVLLSFERY